MSDPKGGHGLEGRLRTLLAALALLGAMLPSAECQQTAGALAGRLTDIHSRPLDGVTVTLKNALSGTEVRTVTGKGGAYRFRDLAPGEYQLVAANPQLGTGTVGGIQVLAGHESRVQTAVAMVREEESLTTAHTGRADTGAVQPVPPSSSTAPELGTRAEAPVTSSAAPAGRVSPETPVIVGLPARAVDSTTLTARVAEPVSPVGNPLTLPIIPSVAGRASGALMAAMAVSADRAALMATPPEIDLARASNVTEVETIITSEQLEAIPLPGRRWENFVLDTPATEVEGDEADTAPGHPAREDSSLSVEGTSARMAFGGRVRGEAGRPLLGAGAMESAVQEFRVAELGNKALTGEGIELQTRKGAAGFHGQVFLFDRQKLWGAQNPFTQWVKETAPGTQTTTPAFTPFPYSPADTENRWGAGVGGQLRWHRLQWFTAIDGNRRNHPAVSTVKHPENFFAQPSNDEMQVLSARLGLSGANPVAEGLQAYSGMLESLAELLGPAPRTSQTWSGFGRLDWRAGERHRFTLQGSEATWNSPGGGLARASETFGTHSFGSSDGSSNWALARWETEIAPHLMAVTQGSMRRAIVETPAEAPASFEQGFLTNAWRQLPQMVVDSRYGFTIGNPSRFGPGSLPDEQVYEAQQRIDWVRRPLGFRAGLDFRHSADATSMLRNHTGTYSYSSVENFVSDALVFGKFGLSDSLDPMHQHNCDQRGKAWRDTAGQLHGLGYLPCYSHYTQTLGPTDWHLSTNDWAGFASLQWHPAKQLVMTAGVRWDREDLPPPIALVNNPDLPLTQRLPLLQNAWSPRVGLALGHDESHWPVLRLGYGIFAGRTNNGMLETALTQTGSPKGDLKFLMRPTDNLQGNAGGAPPFPYVLGGEPGSAVKPAAVEFAPGFHNPEIHQGAVEMDQRLPGRILITLGAMVSLARSLPVTMDTNYDAASNPKTITYAVVDGTGKGPIKTPQITVPFFATWPGSSTAGRLNANYQQITEIASRANSTYEAATMRLSRYARHGLSIHARYTYGHAMDWNPEESTQSTRSSVFDPTNFALEYGPSNQDQRHSASAMAIWQAPSSHTGAEGWLTNGWMLSGIGQFHGGLPYTMRTAGSITREFESNGATIVGLGPGMNGYGGDDRVYGVGRNTYRHPQTWKVDVRLGRRIGFGHGHELELLAESFNLFNHQNVTQVETTGYTVEPGSLSGSFPTLNFLTGLKPGQTEFGLPLNINAVDYYRERQFDLGLRLRF